MAQLFELDENGSIDLNREWIKLNPRIWNIVSRDRGSVGDSGGQSKKVAKNELNFIRMMWSPNSEYADFKESERKAHVLKVLGITENKYDNDEELQLAEEEYKLFLHKLRSYRAWRAAVTSLDAKIDWLTSYSPEKADKQGKLLVTPEQHSKAIKSIHEDMLTIDNYKNMLDKEMEQQIDTRSTLKKGLREDRQSSFKEGNAFLG